MSLLVSKSSSGASNKKVSMKLFSVVAVLFFVLSLCVVNSNAIRINTLQAPQSYSSDPSSQLFPDEIFPLSSFSLEFVDRQVSGQKTYLSSLSTQDIQLKTSYSPDQVEDDYFTPFGNNIKLHFVANGTTYDFDLKIDDKVVSARQGKVNTRVNGNEYVKYSSYVGERINPEGIEEKIFVTITPNSGSLQEQQLASARSNGGYAVQSFQPLDASQGSVSFAPLAMTQDSGRHENGYTTRISLFVGSNRLFIVQSVNSLRYQSIHHIEKLEHQIQQLEKQKHAVMSQNTGMKVQSAEVSKQMDTLAEKTANSNFQISVLENQLKVLTEIQHLSAYDLVLSVAPEEPKLEGCLALKSPNNTSVQPLVQGSSQFAPQWTLHKWDNCHSRQNVTTVLYLDTYFTYTYQLWASDGASTPDHDKVLADAQHQTSIINAIYDQQLSIVWQLNNLTYGANNNDDAWNPLSPTDAKCNNITSNMAAARASTAAESAVLTIFSDCSNTGGTAGVAYIATTCRKDDGSLWSNFDSVWGAFSAYAHELGHSLSAEHSFYDKATGKDDSALAGTFGGIMDYYNTRLADNTRYPSDKRYYGFNIDTTAQWFCPWLDRLWSGEFTGDNYASHCWASAADDVYNYTSSTCGNGVVDQWEECDDTSSCCTSSCKLVTNATCTTSNSQCCVDCVAQPMTTFCDTSYGTKTGYCNRGECVPLPVDTNMYQYVENCEGFFTFRQDYCMFSTPSQATNTSCGSYFSWSSGSVVPIGTLCTNSSGALGICLPSVAFNSTDILNGMECNTEKGSLYTYDLTVRQTCVCDNSTQTYTPAVEDAICYNAGGTVVSSSYCSDQTKPTSYCWCADSYTQIDSSSSGGSSSGSGSNSDGSGDSGNNSGSNNNNSSSPSSDNNNSTTIDINEIFSGNISVIISGELLSSSSYHFLSLQAIIALFVAIVYIF